LGTKLFHTSRPAFSSGVVGLIGYLSSRAAKLYGGASTAVTVVVHATVPRVLTLVTGGMEHLKTCQ
jgi:uncharacterized membrane-anchored protein